MIERVFIVPHTHTDLGYTADVETVLARHCEMLSSLLELCTNGYEDWSGDRYRWTIEASVILRHWWERASSEDRASAVALLRSGRWELTGFETQLLTGISDPLELTASVEWACRMGRQYEFPVSTVMLNDLGGFARGLSSSVCGEGIKYLVSGCGGFRVLMPMAGLPPLFHWEAPDGARVLFWHLGISEELDPRIWETLPAQYGFGNSYVIHPTRDAFSDQEYDDDSEKLKFTVEKMDQAYRRLEKDLYRRGYPYRYLMLQAAGDNRGLDPEMPKWVDLWNRNIDCPKICAATSNEFFGAMVEEYGDDFPVLKGNLHDSCSVLAATNSKGLGEYRSNARTIGLVKAVNKGGAVIEEKISEALRWQLWFSDHTFGLTTWDSETGGRIALDESDTTSPSPKIQRLIDNWNIKNTYTEKAAGILEECKALLQSDKDIMVFVPCEEPTDVIVGLPIGSRPAEKDDAFVQDAADCTWVQWKGLSIGQPGCAQVAGRATRAVPGEGSAISLASDSWRIAFDPADGRLAEVASQNTSRNVLAGSGQASLGDLLVFDVDDMDERPALGAMLNPPTLKAQPIEWTDCERTADGELVSEITRMGVIRCPQGDQELQQRWRLYRSSDVLEIDTLWEKKPRVGWEACYFAAPLNFENPDVLVHQGLTTAHVGCEELPGCYRDQYCVQEWVAVKDASCTVLISPLEAGLIDIDEVRFMQYLTQPITPQTGSLFFLLSHNCWPSNAPCWQGDRLRFRFRMKLLPADVLPEELSRRGSRLAPGALVAGCQADSMAW